MSGDLAEEPRAFRVEELALPPLDGRRDLAPTIVRAYLEEARRKLSDWHLAGASGADIVRAMTATIDRAVVYLHDIAVAEFATRNVRVSGRCAIIAQGGYGRGELSPGSDIDLLFVYQWKVNPFVEWVAEKILYSLWDTGLQVGHAVRSVPECVRLAARDFKVKTALLDTRFLCGDADLGRDLEKAIENDVLKQSADSFFKEKLAESEERRRQFGESVYLLEPQLKEGEGGLRDLQTAFWMARVKFKIRHLKELVQKSVISERDLDSVLASRDFLWRVRNSLHFLSGTHQDQLTFEYQERVAQILGYGDAEERRGVERFMRDYYLHAAVINRFADSVIDRCLEKPSPYRRLTEIFGRRIRPGLRIARGEVMIEDPELLARDPAAIVGIFVESQRHGVPLAQRSKELVRAHAPALGALRERPDVVQPFREILRGRGRVYETLSAMHELEVLDQLIPEFGQLRAMVIRDFYHIYTVDEHTLRGVRALEQLDAGTFKDSAPLCTNVMHDLDDREILNLSMILHDIGKGHGHGHSDRGARLALGVAARLGFDADAANEISRLVRHHLLMSHVAQHRDLEDDRVVVDFARLLEDRETLKKLYVMTFADMKSVAPNVWNTWRDMVIGELYMRALEVFESGAFVVEDPEARAARARARLKAGLAARTPPIAGAHVDKALERLPSTYFLSATEDAFVHHLELWRAFEETRQGAATSVRHVPEREFSEFTVLTADRPGLFSMITGVLTAHAMNILSAKISTARDGTVLDVFRIAQIAREDRMVDERRWQKVRGTLDEVLRGERTIESVAATMPKPSILDGRRVLPPIETSVQIDNQSSAEYSLVEVSAEDRIGVLFAITRTLFHEGCAIHRARISTVLRHVYDVFYVTDGEGRKIVDSGRMQAICNSVRQRLEELRQARSPSE
jgi:[protein-PII] uridylyltransferase